MFHVFFAFQAFSNCKLGFHATYYMRVSMDQLHMYFVCDRLQKNINRAHDHSAAFSNTCVAYKQTIQNPTAVNSQFVEILPIFWSAFSRFMPAFCSILLQYKLTAANCFPNPTCFNLVPCLATQDDVLKEDRGCRSHRPEVT